MITVTAEAKLYNGTQLLGLSADQATALAEVSRVYNLPAQIGSDFADFYVVTPETLIEYTGGFLGLTIAQDHAEALAGVLTALRKLELGV